MGNPDFIDMVVCDVVQEGHLTSLCPERGQICDLSLSSQISKEEATLSQSRSLSLFCRQWGVQVSHCLCPRVAVN